MDKTTLEFFDAKGIPVKMAPKRLEPMERVNHLLLYFGTCDDEPLEAYQVFVRPDFNGLSVYYVVQGVMWHVQLNPKSVSEIRSIDRPYPR